MASEVDISANLKASKKRLDRCSILVPLLVENGTRFVNFQLNCLIHELNCLIQRLSMRRRIYERRIDKFAPKPDITAFGRIGQAMGTSEQAWNDVPILFHNKFRVPVEHARLVLARQCDFELFEASSTQHLEFCPGMG